MNEKLKAGDTYKANGNVYRVYDDGQRLRLWLISQPKADNSDLAEQADYDATMDAAAGRVGY